MAWDNTELPLYIVYFIIAVVSIIGCSMVIAFLVRFGKFNTPFTYVVLYLHISLLLEEIVTLPYVFNDIPAICIIAELIHYYAVLMNIISVGILVHVHLCNVIDSLNHYMVVVEKFGPYIILIFPTVVLLRLADPVYEDTQYPFCVIHGTAFSPLLFFTYYLWIWLILAMCVVRTVQSIYYIHLKADAYIAWRYSRTIGAYTLIALFAWLPTTISTVLYSSPDDDGSTVIRIISYLPLYISGLLYTVIFVRDREAIASFEAYRGANPGELSQQLIMDVSMADWFDLIRSVPSVSRDVSIDGVSKSPILRRLRNAVATSSSSASHSHNDNNSTSNSNSNSRSNSNSNNSSLYLNLSISSSIGNSISNSISIGNSNNTGLRTPLVRAMDSETIVGPGKA